MDELDVVDLIDGLGDEEDNDEDEAVRILCALDMCSTSSCHTSNLTRHFEHFSLLAEDTVVAEASFEWFSATKTTTKRKEN